MGIILISGKELQFQPGATIESVVSGNGFHPDSFLYLIDGKPVPMDTALSEETVVKALRVASGG